MPTPIQSPSGYAATRALAFADVDGNAILASTANPLPVVVGNSAAATPLAGSTAANGTFGPFQPTPGRTVVITLSGTWAGTARILRSTDGGTIKLPLTLAGSVWGEYAANCCEPVWEENEAGATLWLDVALTSGTVNYRLSQ